METKTLEATVIAVDPLEGKYKVHGPDGKEYQFEQRRAITLTGYFLLDNGVEKGMFHKMSEASSKGGGAIFLYDKQMNDLEYAAFFEKKDDSYVVKLDLNDAGEEINPNSKNLLKDLVMRLNNLQVEGMEAILQAGNYPIYPYLEILVTDKFTIDVKY